MNSKPWYKSKVVWTNALTILVVLAAFLGVSPDQELAESIAALLLGVSPVLNLLLRPFTGKPLS